MIKLQDQCLFERYCQSALPLTVCFSESGLSIFPNMTRHYCFGYPVIVTHESHTSTNKHPTSLVNNLTWTCVSPTPVSVKWCLKQDAKLKFPKLFKLTTATSSSRAGDNVEKTHTYCIFKMVVHYGNSCNPDHRDLQRRTVSDTVNDRVNLRATKTGGCETSKGQTGSAPVDTGPVR